MEKFTVYYEEVITRYVEVEGECIADALESFMEGKYSAFNSFRASEKYNGIVGVCKSECSLKLY
jgi:hypothetical protein